MRHEDACAGACEASFKVAQRGDGESKRLFSQLIGSQLSTLLRSPGTHCGTRTLWGTEPQLPAAVETAFGGRFWCRTLRKVKRLWGFSSFGFLIFPINVFDLLGFASARLLFVGIA